MSEKPFIEGLMAGAYDKGRREETARILRALDKVLADRIAKADGRPYSQTISFAEVKELLQSNQTL